MLKMSRKSIKYVCMCVCAREREGVKCYWKKCLRLPLHAVYFKCCCIVCSGYYHMIIVCNISCLLENSYQQIIITIIVVGDIVIIVLYEV